MIYTPGNMVTGFDIWSHDPALRRHWKGRFAAFLADAAITFIPTSVVLFLMGVEDPVLIGLACSVIFYLASSVPETLSGASVGKRLMGFRVHPVSGESLAGKACMRNIPRFFWFALPPIDFALGMATRGDPREKMFDRLAGTRVVHTGETERHENALKAIAAEADDEKEKNRDAAETCHECGGKLMRLPNEKLQCEKCGVIQ
jgi:uncharacterized RDD family membrane protein YckC/ribosomal protein S27AE